MEWWEREQEYLRSLAEREAEESLQEEVIKPMKHKVMTLVQPMDSVHGMEVSDAELEAALDNDYTIEHVEIYRASEGWMIERVIILVKRAPEEPAPYEPAKDDAIPF